MAVQDKSVVTDLNSIVMPSSCLCLGPKAPSQPTELSLSGEEHGLKVRKAYTITKQRERWTEEEHKKFLEALKLYGRAWRRIEEHIGSKNAVQIRSHAQKFFSKVVRESACSSAGTVKPIEIPPPRPKRKPMHPYPRKQGHSSNKGIQPVLQQNERSISMTPSSDQENRSPKSVLSAVGSDIMGSSFTNLQNCCNSPDSSGTGSNPVGSMPREQEDICQSRFSSDEEENGSNYQSKGENGSSILGSATDMKLDSISVDNFFSKEGSSVEAPATSLKLFGRTVMIPNSHRPSSSVGGNTLQSHKSSPSIDNGSHQKTTEADLQSTAQTTVERDFCGAACESAWNSWPYGVPPLFYCMPFQNESMNSAEAPAGASLALPWWSLCGGLPFPLIHPSNISLQQNPLESCTGSPDHKEMMHKDGSSTGSDTTSVSEYGPAVKNCHIVDSETVQPSSMAFQLKASKNSAFTSMKSGASNRPARGFVPYKRCLSRKSSVEVADWQ